MDADAAKADLQAAQAAGKLGSDEDVCAALEAGAYTRVLQASLVEPAEAGVKGLLWLFAVMCVHCGQVSFASNSGQWGSAALPGVLAVLVS